MEYHYLSGLVVGVGLVLVNRKACSAKLKIATNKLWLLFMQGLTFALLRGRPLGSEWYVKLPIGLRKRAARTATESFVI